MRGDVDRLVDTDELRGDADNPVIQMQAELHTVLNRYNHIRRQKPEYVATLLIEIVDTIRQRHNLDHEVEHVGADVYTVEMGEMGGWVGAPRSGEYADVDEQALREMVDESGGGD